MPRTRHPDETDDPGRRAGGLPEYRARAQYRGTRSVQSGARRFLPPGRERPLAAPRPPLHDRLDFGDVTALGPAIAVIASAAKQSPAGLANPMGIASSLRSSQ